MLKPLPSGIEFFEEFSQKGYYYVDKTLFIKNLIDNMGKVNLFTRPRRFGKTLTLDMLRCFFEEGRDPGMFAGLKILEAGEKYTSMMGKYPVIFLTLKSAKTGDEKRAFSAMLAGNARGFETEINKLLRSSISYYDSYEAFYHGFMAGLFVGAQDFAVRSNRESGDGRSDLLVLPVSVFDRAFVIELKAVKSKKGQKTVTREDMDNAADEALKQIEDLHYTDALMDEGYSVIGRYGIAFFRKDCRVHYLEGYPQEDEGQKEIFAKNQVASYKPFRNAD